LRVFAFGFGSGRHHAGVGGEPVRQREVAAGGDLLLVEVDAVDGEEVGV
jgi:hypothetical protein